MKNHAVSIAKQRRISFILLTIIAVLSLITSSIIAIYALHLYDTEKIFGKRMDINHRLSQSAERQTVVLYGIIQEAINRLESNPLTSFLDNKRLDQIKHVAVLAAPGSSGLYNLMAKLKDIAEDGIELSFKLLLAMMLFLLLLNIITYILTIYLPDRNLNKELNLIAKKLQQLETGEFIDKKGVATKETALLVENADRVIRKTLNITRMYQTLSAVNEAIIRIKNESKLFNDICNIFVNQGKFKLACIGLFNTSGNITKTYCYGDKNSVKCAEKILKKDPYNSPIIRSMQKKQIFINNNTSLNENMPLRKNEMLKRGYNSSASVPIIKKGKLAGTLNIYSDKIGFFAKENYRLLNEISKDISSALDKQEDKKWVQIYSTLLNQSSEYVAIMDKNFNFVYVNDAAINSSGYSRGELIGKHRSIFSSGLNGEQAAKRFYNTLSQGKLLNDLITYRTKTGTLIYGDTTVIPVTSNDGVKYFISTVRDITDEKKLQKSMNKLLFFDPVTNLPNKSQFEEEMAAYITMNAEDGLSALIIIDPKEFALINNGFGYEVGDMLLRQMGIAISDTVYDKDITAKLQENRFAVFIKTINSKENIIVILNKIEKALSRPFHINSHDISIAISMGIASYPDDGRQPQELISKANIALIDAKSQGKSYCFFSKRFEDEVTKALMLKESLKNALQKREFVLYYQPYINIKTGAVAGAEALIRWKKEGKIIPPDSFISVLEKSNMIKDVEEWIMEMASSDIKMINNNRSAAISVSINISAASFKGGNLTDQILYHTNNCNIDPSIFHIEITERMFMKDRNHAKTVLSSLRKAGIQIAVDDFGTGYSSLSYIESLPVDILKIDISFIRKMMKDKRALTIVKTIISLAGSLKLETIAEGVETEDQAKILAELGCDYIQGFLYAKPMPTDQFEIFLKQWQSRLG